METASRLPSFSVSLLQIDLTHRLDNMDINQILRWIVIAIVMIVAVVLLDAMLGLVGFMVKLALPVLLVLLVLAIILRFISMLRARR